jgi:hypothetical protein
MSTPASASNQGPHGVERAGPRDELFRVLVDSVEDYAIFVLSPEGRVLTWNSGARNLKGYEPDAARKLTEELGLDPGLGVLHRDRPNRDSLACDLMEPVRPLVDAYLTVIVNVIVEPGACGPGIPRIVSPSGRIRASLVHGATS